MASEVDICNLALGHLGDNATIASIDPPEGSAQAEHCARFYPIARDSLLQMHAWNFATKRATLAQLGSAWPQWQYTYAQPADALVILAVMPPDATDDYAASPGNAWPYGYPANLRVPSWGQYTPQNFSCEVDDTNNPVIYTDQGQAMARYVARITDPTKFSPLFVNTLSWYLASMLAGPILKGEAGAAEAKRCLAMMQMWLSKATTSDANQRRTDTQHLVSWVTGR